MTTFAYPYDPTGAATGNIVTGEVHNLANYTNAYRCVIPLQAPFFRNDILIKHVNSGRTLHEGLDYYFGYYYDELSDTVKQAVYGGIIFFDKALVGSIRIERYHTVGGFYLQRKKDLEAFLAIEPMQDPRNVDFSAVMKWPRAVTAIEEPDTLAEAIATDPVVKALDGMDRKLREIYEDQKDQFEIVFQKLSSLSSTIRNYKFFTHYYGTDPHKVTYAQLGALGKNQTAKDALTAYGYSVSQLITLINKMGITPENASRWYELIGGAFEGRISITEGSIIAIKNALGTALINVNTGQIQILAESNVEISADTDKNSLKMGALFQAGNNTLSVHSNTTGTHKNSAVYNGYYLIHVGNIADFVSTKTTSAKLDLHLGSTTDVVLIGAGTTADPLTGVVSFPVASETLRGLLRLTDETTSSSTTIGVTGKALYTVVQKIADYAVKTTTVNGKPLTSDITITKADIGLGNVDNTYGFEKAISNAFNTAIGNKSLDGHTHVLSDLNNIPVATNTVKGITKLANTPGTSTSTAATPAAGLVVSNTFDDVEEMLDEKLDTVKLPIIEWGRYTDLSTANVSPLGTYSGWVLTLSTLRYTDTDGWVASNDTIDISDAGLTTYQSTVVYIYINRSGVVSLSNSSNAESPTSSYIGYLNTDATGITKLSLSPVYRILNNRELLDHMALTNAHGHAWNDKGWFGLSNIQNKTLVDEISLPTFADVFNSWYRFSHSSTGVYPAVPAEINNWSYDSTTDSIKCTVNSGSYIGFASTEAMGDFTFDAAVSSTDTDDDMIGLVIGFYKDPSTGKEHTLSLIRQLSRDTPALTTSILLTYNYGQADVWNIDITGEKVAYGWSDVGECRIRAIRAGNIYTLSMWKTDIDGGGLEYTRTLDLDSDARLSVFKGSTRYGYACHSQNSTTFRSITRPDEDGRNYYVSEQAIRNVLADVEDNAIFTQGTVVNGGTVPLPLGFTAAQCKIFVVPSSFPDPNGSIKYLDCYVTGQVCTCRASADGTTWRAGTARYYLFGVK